MKMYWDKKDRRVGATTHTHTHTHTQEKRRTGRRKTRRREERLSGKLVVGMW